MGPVKRETPYVVPLAMTGLVRGYGLIFHMNYRETGPDDNREFRKRGRRRQSQISSSLLIGCGKLENPVHACGKWDCVS